MKIIIDELAYINRDQYNHSLYVKEPKTMSHLTKDANGYTTKVVGHYRSVERALIALRDYRLHQKDTTVTIDEYFLLLKAENDRMDDKVKSIKLAYALK